MSRIYWDTMLFIYLLEDHPVFSPRTRELLERAYKRGDSLYTSYLALGEMMAGASKSPHPKTAAAVAEIIQEMGFTFLPFDGGAVAPFSALRSQQKLKVADSVHLACAASVGVDLYLTGDTDLFKLDVPGIQFIADFNSSIL
jgi:predicted nucleic acid-binding protein